MNKTIYSYYESIARTSQPEEFGCANYWKASWTKAGWNPVMLNKSHAQASNMYGKLQQKLVSMMYGAPSELVSQLNWITARYTRWCALHAAGGGWMSDYDVYNMDLFPALAREELAGSTLAVNKGKAYLFYATKEHVESGIKKFITSDLISDKKLVSEATTLGCKNNLDKIVKLVKHVHSTKLKSRSEIMKNFYEK